MGKQILLSLLSMVLIVGGFEAAARTVSCNRLLQPEQESATPFQFAMSDLEGLYMELVQDAAELTLAFQAPNARKLEVFFKKKAEFLNRFSRIVFLLRSDRTEKLRSRIKARQLALMVYHLGVAPNSFGFEMTPEGEILLSPFPRKNPIGFVDFSKNAQQEDEKEKATPRYSIGFAPMTVKEDEVPLRQGGGIEFMELAALQEVVVGDFEKRQILKVSSAVLRSMGAETDEKVMQLTYSQNESEWIVAFQSKVNPSGQMGFLPVTKGND